MGERVKKKAGKQTDKVYMVIPAYNEAENIYTVVDEWYRILEKEDVGEESRLLVIDDAETAGSDEAQFRTRGDFALRVSVCSERRGRLYFSNGF